MLVYQMVLEDYILVRVFICIHALCLVLAGIRNFAGSPKPSVFDGAISIVPTFYLLAFTSIPITDLKFNPYKLRILFVGHRQTVQSQTRRRKTRRLIRLSTIWLQTFLLKFEKKNEKYQPTTIKTEMDRSN